MTDASVKIYSNERCPYCVSAKALLDQRGIAYEEVNMAMDADGRAKLARETGMMTFPQVFVGDELIGGFQQLVAADRSGRLRELTAA